MTAPTVESGSPRSAVALFETFRSRESLVPCITQFDSPRRELRYQSIRRDDAVLLNRGRAAHALSFRKSFLHSEIGFPMAASSMTGTRPESALRLLRKSALRDHQNSFLPGRPLSQRPDR